MERKIKTHLVKDDKDTKTQRHKDTKTQRQTVRKINDKEVWKRSGKFLCCVWIRHGGFNLSRKSRYIKKVLARQ